MVGFGRLLYLVGVALAVVLPVRTWVGEPIVVASPSMHPTLKTGTLLILDKWSLHFRPPRRGEIISFRSPVDENDMIKRVIAVPGDVVEIREKKVFLNGSPLDEPYAAHDRAGQLLEGDNLGPLTVPPESYFMLGDNRDESRDSTVWKTSSGEPLRFLKGKAVQGIVRRLPWAP